MTTDEIPNAVWEGTFSVFGLTLRCYTLDNGQRIINADDFHDLMERLQAGSDEDLMSPEMEVFAKWQAGARGVVQGET